MAATGRGGVRRGRLYSSLYFSFLLAPLTTTTTLPRHPPSSIRSNAPGFLLSFLLPPTENGARGTLLTRPLAAKK